MLEKEPRTIRVSPSSEMALVLADAQASGADILIDTGDSIYPLKIAGRSAGDTIGTDERVSASMLAGYEPTRVRAALAASAGALSGMDVSQLVRDVRAQREQHSQGRPA